LAAAAAVIALIATVVLVVVFTKKGGDRPTSSPTTGPTGSAPPGAGPFTGVYRAEFSASSANGKPDQKAQPSTGQWAVRSYCFATGCMATAAATGGPTLQSSFVFDEIGDQWIAVGVATPAAPPVGVSGFAGCTFPAEYWTVLSLQAKSDGTLVGRYRAASQIGPCATERTVIFTRTGDVTPESLPDPDRLARRVASPAQAWRGRYHATRTPQDKYPPTTWDAEIQTDCLRTGDRCISYDVEQAAVYLFANGKWVWTADGKNKCNGTQEVQDKASWELPLPQPPADPIYLLTGHGHRDVIGGACARSYNEDVKFERTGD
jgi:serine/threonine-protein kinase